MHYIITKKKKLTSGRIRVFCSSISIFPRDFFLGRGTGLLDKVSETSSVLASFDFSGTSVVSGFFAGEVGKGFKFSKSSRSSFNLNKIIINITNYLSDRFYSILEYCTKINKILFNFHFKTCILPH